MIKMTKSLFHILSPSILNKAGERTANLWISKFFQRKRQNCSLKKLYQNGKVMTKTSLFKIPKKLKLKPISFWARERGSTKPGTSMTCPRLKREILIWWRLILSSRELSQKQILVLILLQKAKSLRILCEINQNFEKKSLID